MIPYRITQRIRSLKRQIAQIREYTEEDVDYIQDKLLNEVEELEKELGVEDAREMVRSGNEC